MNNNGVLVNPFNGMPMSYGNPAPGTPVGTYGNNSVFNGGTNAQQEQSSGPVVGLNWVTGIEQVNNTTLQANTGAIFFDSNIKGRYYLKYCDNLGKPTLEIWDSTEITSQFTKSGDDLSNFVNRDEFKNLSDKFDKLISILGGQNNEHIRQNETSGGGSEFKSAVDAAISSSNTGSRS